MEMFLATKSSTPIIGQVAQVMGWIMDGIYKLLSAVGIHNLGLCIIIFSIIIYALMTPLQIKQQKFSKLSSIMQPELQKVQKKYQGKKDQASMQKMQEETQAIYEKYGVSPTGSCVQLAIQFPILLALWQVIYKIPAYVSGVREVFTEAVSHIVAVDGYTELIKNFISDNKMSRVQLVMDSNGVATKNSVIDFLYALSPSQWTELSDMDAVKTGAILLAIGAVLIPFLAWLTQVLNLKLMPQAGSQSDDPTQNTVASSMKTMNTVMPLMSAVFCFTFPVGLGIYWIASAVVRSIQQVVINRHMDKMDINVLINENMKKMEKKREKAGLPPQKITNQAHQNARNINNTKVTKGQGNQNVNDRMKKVEESYQKAQNAKPGSITAKANMVRDFDERNKKK